MQLVITKKLSKGQYINQVLQIVCIQIILATFCKLPALSQTPLKSTPLQSQELNSNNQPEDIELDTANSELAPQPRLTLSKVHFASISRKDEHSFSVQSGSINVVTSNSNLNLPNAELTLSEVKFASISQQGEHNFNVQLESSDIVTSTSNLNSPNAELTLSEVKFASMSQQGEHNFNIQLESSDIVTSTSNLNSPNAELTLSEVKFASMSQQGEHTKNLTPQQSALLEKGDSTPSSPLLVGEGLGERFLTSHEKSELASSDVVTLTPELLLSQVSSPSVTPQGGLNPSIQSGGVDPLQLAPDSSLDSSARDLNLSQQYPLPTTPSQPGTPNQNVQPGGVDPLQTAPDSRVDQFNPNRPLEKLEGNAELTEVLVRNAIINTAGRYPWVIDPTDKLTFSALLFRPGEKEVYSSFDFQSIDGGSGVNRFSVGVFPKKDSFYWILDDNQVVMETKGELYGVSYQGESKETHITRTMDLVQSYGGNQFIAALAPDMERLLRNPDSNTSDASNASVLSVAAQVTNPSGIQAPQIIINNPAISNNSGNITNIQFPSQSNFFNNIDIANAPRVLQAYPTLNIQSLASLGFYRGEIIPTEVLKEAGITFGSIYKNAPPQFTPTVSSTAGIKVLQSGKFDNPDLLRMLLDRSLSDGERKTHYFNSLYWTSFGIRGENQTETINKSESYKWYRFYASQAHNRVLIRYHKDKPEATYTQVFANPGISLTFRPDTFDVDAPQTIINSVGLLTGLIFDQINPENINKLLQTARERYNKKQTFSALQTKATTDERRQINRRLNSTLAFTNLASGVEQLSGQVTFSSSVKPNQSSLWQVRSGLYRRSVLFFESQSDVTSGPISFGETRFSPERLGPLGFANSFVPENRVDNQNQSNESFAVQTLVTTGSGRQFLFQDSSNSLLGVPVPARATALVFDRFELRRSETQKIKNYIFSGYKFLPATELVFSGTNKNLNYSVSVGTWINPNADQLLNVSDNQSVFKEPTVGVYTNASVTSTNLKITRDAKGNPSEIFNFSPSLTLRLNSASSVLNQNVVALSSLFYYQNRSFEFAVAPGIQYANQLIGVLPASLRFRNGLSFETALELGERLYYRFETLKTLNRDLSLGLYVRNFTDIDRNRINGHSYGLKVRFNVPKTVLFTDFTVGNSSQGLDIRLQGSINF
ncbi:hypothetical protein NIES4071_76770 [Calothrix sp. NIES-4071]|nr:hypothetical protein NIES4071_76770 [Calothrix sp. NIES-4071]BAZ61951.1 hypothetical protein NIES4105_76710 [Calothrix sp. NIES-4105]